MRSRAFLTASMVIFATACAPHQGTVVFDLRPAVSRSADDVGPGVSVETSYSPVSEAAAAILGCGVNPDSPVCSTAIPNAEEDSAFRAEGERLILRRDSPCRRLGAAINSNASQVRMYRKALVKETGPMRLYAVGHAYELGYVWQVRVARRIDELNERTLEQKKRTLRHEMSHTIGAPEGSSSGWSAEDYAVRCG